MWSIKLWNQSWSESSSLFTGNLYHSISATRTPANWHRIIKPVTVKDFKISTTCMAKASTGSANTVWISECTTDMHCYWLNILCPQNVGMAWTSIMVIYLPWIYLSQLTKQQTLETEIVQFSATDKLWWNLQVLLDFWVVVSSADQSLGGVQCILWVGDSLTPRWSAYNSLIVRRESNDRWRRPCPFTVLQHPRCLPLHYRDTRVGGAEVNANDMTFDLVWPSTEKCHRMRWKQYRPPQQLRCDRYYHKISSITYGTGVQFWAQIWRKTKFPIPTHAFCHYLCSAIIQSAWSVHFCWPRSTTEVQNMATW